METIDIPYELIDTHCHLYLEEFSEDLPGYISRASHEGVKEIFMPSLDRNHFHSMLGVEDTYPDICRSMAGLHPCYVDDNYLDELRFVEEALKQRTFVAVGEIGLDFYWDTKYAAQQLVCFREPIAMARSANLPIVIHSRSSMDEVIQVLKDQKADGIRGIFHCFSGSYENAMAVIDCGMLLGIGGVVTYKNAGLAEVISRIDLEHLVIETDAPYLSPVPFRGKRNESSYLRYIVSKIAEVKQVRVDEVAAITTRNARHVFGRHVKK